MHALIKELRQEHQGHRQLLALLKRKLAKLEQGMPPNYGLIEDTINYIGDYAGRYHHPKEDIVYQYIIKKGLDFHGDFDKVVKEHNRFDQLTSPLSKSLQSILLDIIVPRETFIVQLSDFILAEQSHLDSEDNHIFPLIETLLAEDDWLLITAALPVKNEDPLFGEKVHNEYLDLYHRLSNIEPN